MFAVRCHCEFYCTINYFPTLLKFILNTQLLEHNVTVAILSSQECIGHWSCKTSSSPQGICFHQQPEGLLNISEGATFFFFKQVELEIGGSETYWKNNTVTLFEN